MANLKKTILKYLPVNFFASATSYAQDGEDMILKSLFEQRKGYKGFFVDVGAHHPVRFSNTRFFYKRGWKGINIEPTPDAFALFRHFRKRDINLNIGIGPEKGALKFYCFNEPALNSFSREVSERINRESTKYKIIKTIDVPVLPLSAVLDEFLPRGQKIDFISIDVEGLDFQVLQSNDWEKYLPEIILIEEHVDVDHIKDSPIYMFLKEKGYRFIAKTWRTCIYRLGQ